MAPPTPLSYNSNQVLFLLPCLVAFLEFARAKAGKSESRLRGDSSGMQSVA